MLRRSTMFLFSSWRNTKPPLHGSKPSDHAVYRTETETHGSPKINKSIPASGSYLRDVCLIGKLCVPDTAQGRDAGLRSCGASHGGHTMATLCFPPDESFNFGRLLGSVMKISPRHPYPAAQSRSFPMPRGRNRRNDTGLPC